MIESIWIVVSAVVLTALLTGITIKARTRKQLHALEIDSAELRQRLQLREEQLLDMKHLQEESISLKTTLSSLQTQLEEERKSSTEKLAMLEQAKDKLTEAFQALSGEALKSNNQAFLELAKTTLDKFQSGAQTDLAARQKAIDELVKPVKETLDKVDLKLHEIEKERVSSFASVSEQLQAVTAGQAQLQIETNRLVGALRSTGARGRWGEVQLRRVIELSGMANHCDFIEQVSTNTEAGRIQPDLVVKLPSNRTIIVDSKVPLESYLDALQAPDDVTRELKLRDHARQLRAHISSLSSKNYWQQFERTPDFVVLFLPGDIFYTAAIEKDPTLLEFAVEQRVLVATPFTLIALLRAVAVGWREETLAKSAEQIRQHGVELYRRVRTLGDHFQKLGRGLNQTLSAYNQAVGTLEGRVLSSARRFRDLGVSGGEEIPTIVPIDRIPRDIQAEELVLLPDEEDEESVVNS